MRSRSFGRRLLLTLLASSLFLSSDPAGAQENEQSGTEAAFADSPNKDLLLFWEEKELYVQTATRTAKPISQVAENLVVVTAKDIADMNAHNVAEILRRVPGLFVDLTTSDFGTISALHIQGSYDRHVTVLLDGVLWNFLGGGNAEVGSIPAQIIDRIEIIKGPASSTWGSALGGVVNIITKNAGDSKLPKGMLSASYGEKNSQDHNAELYGKGGPIGYYLHAGRQASDGLLNDREYQRDSFYGKMTASLSHNVDLAFTIGYSNPVFDLGAVPLAGTASRAMINAFWATGALDYRISPQLNFKAAAYTLAQKVDTPVRRLSDHSLKKQIRFDEQTVGGNLKLAYASGVHSAVLGADLSNGALDQTVTSGGLSSLIRPSLDKWAIFGNDTIAVGKLAITPGLRLDHNNVSGYFVSPNLGATYEVDEHVIARASVARGFTSPPLSASMGGGLRTVPNPDLTAEYGWSYQAGLESAVMDHLNLKGNLFRHDTRNELVDVQFDSSNVIYRNMGKVVRQGYELEAETAPVYNVSLNAAHAFVHIDADSKPESTVNYSYQVGVKYDDRESLLAQLAGTYIWWDLPSDPNPALNARYNSFVWDLNLSKKFRISETTSVDAFMNVHNLFNGSQYTVSAYPNPGRWVEGGVRVNF
ncbi:MAG: hypothetical protein A2075_13675 [Geobacteraceae bacterium GWC2_58_44]|nr:MAG: hypothetical protein A2075_13675 [Geobacteraceae bacterium GWC2_58_44]